MLRFRTRPRACSSGEDARFAASAGRRPVLALVGDGRLDVWDARDGSRVARQALGGRAAPTGGSDKLDRLAFSADGRRLVCLRGDRVYAWDTADWTARSWQPPGPAPAAVAVSAGGQTVATATAAGVVQLWDAGAGAAAGPPLDLSGRVARGDGLVAVDFAADGLTALAGFASGRVVIWDVG